MVRRDLPDEVAGGGRGWPAMHRRSRTADRGPAPADMHQRTTRAGDGASSAIKRPNHARCGPAAARSTLRHAPPTARPGKSSAVVVRGRLFHRATRHDRRIGSGGAPHDRRIGSGAAESSRVRSSTVRRHRSEPLEREPRQIHPWRRWQPTMTTSQCFDIEGGFRLPNP